SAIEQAVKAIRNRVDKWGVSEPTIAKRGDTSILVQLPGYSNPEKAKELLGRTAQLELKIVDDQNQIVTQLKDLPPGVTLDVEDYEGAGGALVRVPYLRSKDGVVLRQFVQGKAPAGEEFGIQKIEDRLKPINEILREAQDLTVVLKAGALPAPVRILEERSVGASLGPELIKRGSLAALIGLFAVLLFMAAYYRFSGVVADVALVLNGLVVLAVMALLDSTLTLPGIAGFVLTLGMAVDANVLINERIREEMKQGRSIAQAVQTG